MAKVSISTWRSRRCLLVESWLEKSKRQNVSEVKKKMGTARVNWEMHVNKMCLEKGKCACHGLYNPARKGQSYVQVWDQLSTLTASFQHLWCLGC